MKRHSFITLFGGALSAATTQQHDIHFNSLAKTWDEAIPLSNGMLGALVWQKEDQFYQPF